MGKGKETRLLHGLRKTKKVGTGMSKNEDSKLTRTQVKCHGRFKASLAIKDDKVTITFNADRKTVDLNKLGGNVKRWRYSHFCERSDSIARR